MSTSTLKQYHYQVWKGVLYYYIRFYIYGYVSSCQSPQTHSLELHETSQPEGINTIRGSFRRLVGFKMSEFLPLSLSSYLSQEDYGKHGMA